MTKLPEKQLWDHPAAPLCVPRCFGDGGHRSVGAPGCSRQKAEQAPPCRAPVPACCPGAFVHLPLEPWHRRAPPGLRAGSPRCSSLSISPGGEIRRDPRPGSGGKVGQVSQGVPCSFHQCHQCHHLLLVLPVPCSCQQWQLILLTLLHQCDPQI